MAVKILALGRSYRRRNNFSCGFSSSLVFLYKSYISFAQVEGSATFFGPNSSSDARWLEFRNIKTH